MDRSTFRQVTVKLRYVSGEVRYGVQDSIDEVGKILTVSKHKHGLALKVPRYRETSALVPLLMLHNDEEH